jgi:hypothetical protein
VEKFDIPQLVHSQFMLLCIQCGMPNISTSIFNNYSFVSPNPFDNLNNLGKTINNNNDVHVPSKSLLPPTSIERIVSQLSQQSAFCFHVTALWQVPHGHHVILFLFCLFVVVELILLDSCNTWYHIDCQNEHPHIYECMNASNTSWECIQCGMPNISTLIFNNYSFVSPNPFDKLPSITTVTAKCFLFPCYCPLASATWPSCDFVSLLLVRSCVILGTTYTVRV